MKFNEALVQQQSAQERRIKLDLSYDQKLEELRNLYEKRKVTLEDDFTKAEDVLNAESLVVRLDDPRVKLGSRAIRIVGDWSLAGRDGQHCCHQAALNLARTEGGCLGSYSYCTVTQGVVHGLYQIREHGQIPNDNTIPLFRIEGTPEVIHRLRTGSRLPDNVVEAASYFVHNLPTLFALGWKWESAMLDTRDLFAGDPRIAEELTKSEHLTN